MEGTLNEESEGRFTKLWLLCVSKRLLSECERGSWFHANTEKENKDRVWPQGGEEGSHCCCSPKPITVRAAAVSRERWLLKRVLA